MRVTSIDCNAEFEYINAKVIAAQAHQQRVISVDTKKKELIGDLRMAEPIIVRKAPHGG